MFFKKYRCLLKNTSLWASKYRFVFPEVGMSVFIKLSDLVKLFHTSFARIGFHDVYLGTTKEVESSISVKGFFLFIKMMK